MRVLWIHAALPLFLSLVLLPGMDAVAQEKTVGQRAQELISQEKYAEARPLLEKELQENELLADNDRTNLLFLLAYALLKLEEYRPSINTWHAMIEYVPKHPLIWGNLGWSYYLNGDVDSAIIATEHALLADSTQAWIWGNMGLYRLARGDVEGMHQAYSQLPRLVIDMDGWKALQTDYQDLCRDPSRVGCEKAAETLNKVWMNLLLRWYAESTSEKGRELVHAYPDEYRQVQKRLGERMESSEGVERDQISALLERLGKDLE